jgi:DNA polymerase gamma 1
MAISYISPKYHERIYGKPQPITRAFKNTAQLKLYDLDQVKDPSETIPELEIPKEIGTLKELREEIEVKVKPIRHLIEMLINATDTEVTVPNYRKGWQKYYKGRWVRSRAPKNKIMVLDTETVPAKDGHRSYPFLCVAQTITEVYVWWGDGTKMVDLGPGNIIVAHNASYDRSMVDLSYKHEDKTIWVDTFSLATAVRGVSRQQISAWKASQKKKWCVERWVKEFPGGLGLDDLYSYYEGEELDKGERDKIVKMRRDYLKSPSLLDSFSYCLKDVIATRKILSHLWREWLDSCPSELSLRGMLLMSQEKIPLSYEWQEYIERAENKYQEALQEMESKLKAQALKVLESGDRSDEWYSQLDWTTTKKCNIPAWYKKIQEKVSLNNKDVAFILRLSYKGYPIVWHDFREEGAKRSKNGFGYVVDGKVIKIKNPSANKSKDGKMPVVRSFFTKSFRDDLENEVITSESAEYHRDDLEEGVISSETGELKELLALLTSTLNWTSSQKRIKGVFYVPEEELEVNWAIPNDKVIGTLTRRKAGPMWPVISNQKEKRIGTETKCHIKAPKGYSFVQTDVDSEELRIFALLGDMTGKGLAATSPLAVSVLCGQKSKGNDVHSLVGQQLGIERSQAKGLVYGTIYGMSLSGFKDTLKRANPKWSDKDINEKAQRYQEYFKTGQRGVPGIGHGSFKGLDEAFKESIPRTNILKSAITKTLRGTSQFTTTRKNWVVQSAGRDFLDTYISFVDLMAEKMGVAMKLFMTVHDSIHYIVPEGQEEKAAKVIALAHTYTWSLVIEAMDLETLPKALLLPESIDVDKMVRKTPFDPCITPSKPEKSEPGYIFTPEDLAKIS